MWRAVHFTIAKISKFQLICCYLIRHVIATLYIKTTTYVAANESCFTSKNMQVIIIAIQFFRKLYLLQFSTKLLYFLYVSVLYYPLFHCEFLQIFLSNVSGAFLHNAIVDTTISKCRLYGTHFSKIFKTFWKSLWIENAQTNGNLKNAFLLRKF